MTARQTAVQTAIAMKGQRAEVVQIYNSFLPHPRGYIVKADSDQLCATYASAPFIVLSWTDIVPPECGARQLYRNMEAIGSSSENTKRVPQVGDLIFFGTGSKPSGINHVGIVVDVTNNNKRVVYYDISTSGRVGQHYIPVGDPWICGYGLPDYASKDVPSPTPTPTPTPAHEFKVGDLVTVNAGAKWYKGQSIKASVFKDQWYVLTVKGDRVVLGMNLAETRNIQSPIHAEDLTLVTPDQPAVTDQQVTISVTVHEETWQLLQIMADGKPLVGRPGDRQAAGGREIVVQIGHAAAPENSPHFPLIPKNSPLI